MAFLLNKITFSALRLNSQVQKADDSLTLSTRGFHVEPGAREKAWFDESKDFWTEARKLNLDLLAEDPALNRFKSYKKSVKRLKVFGDVLTIVVVAGCCYEIYVRAVMREETRKQAEENV